MLDYVRLLSTSYFNNYTSYILWLSNYHKLSCTTMCYWICMIRCDVRGCVCTIPVGTMQMFSCRFALPKHFDFFFDYFCKYHDGRGFGKKLGWFDHLNYRKKTTSIYKRDERCGFYFKNQPKETLRGGELEDRKKIEHVVYYVLPLGYLRVQAKICEFMSS